MSNLICNEKKILKNCKPNQEIGNTFAPVHIIYYTHYILYFILQFIKPFNFQDLTRCQLSLSVWTPLLPLPARAVQRLHGLRHALEPHIPHLSTMQISVRLYSQDWVIYTGFCAVAGKGKSLERYVLVQYKQ